MEDVTDLGEVHVGGQAESDRAGRGRRGVLYRPAQESSQAIPDYSTVQYSTVQYSTVQY